MDIKNDVKNLSFWLLSLAFGYWGYGMVKLFAPKTQIVVFGAASVDNAIAVVVAMVVSAAVFWLLKRRFARPPVWLPDADAADADAAEPEPKPLPVAPHRSQEVAAQAGAKPKAVYHCPCGARFVEPLVYKDFVDPDVEELVCPECYTPQPARAKPAATAQQSPLPPPPQPATPSGPSEPEPAAGAPPEPEPEPAPASSPSPAPKVKEDDRRQVIINIYTQDAAKGGG